MSTQVNSADQTGLYQSIQDNIVSAWNSTTEKVSDFFGSIQELVSKVITAVGDFFTSTVEWIKDKCGYGEDLSKKNIEDITETATKKAGKTDKKQKPEKNETTEKTDGTTKTDSKTKKKFLGIF